LFGLSSLELKLAGLAIIVLAFAGWLAWHDHAEIAKGEARIIAADKKASDALEAKTKAETEREQAKADAANVGAKNAQDAVNQWILDHPTQPVRLCLNANDRGPELPNAAKAGAGATSAAAGSAALPKVLGGDPGPDISAGLDAILSAATELGIVYQESFKRSTP
jgi:hypothetical protein